VGYRRLRLHKVQKTTSGIHTVRIVAFTDIHNAFETVDSSLSSESAFDVVVLGGDLTTFGTPEEARRGIEMMQRFGKPLVVVAGNMDPPELDGEFTRLGVSVNARGVLINGIGFFGVSAAPISRLRTPNEITEEEIEHRTEAGWKAVAGSSATVFVPHAPPAKTKLDRTFAGLHVGSSAVRKAIETYQPDVVICGHIHEARGTDRIGKSQMVNCGAAAKGYYAIVNIGAENKIDLEMKRWES